jgi:hypothetical protein
MTSPRRGIAIVCEDRPDFELAAGLARRIAGDGANPFRLDDQSWLQNRGYPFLKWASIKALASEFRIRAHGHFAGQPGEPDAQAARRAILLVQKLFPEFVAILLIRDSDGDASRKIGLEQARADSGHRDRIVLGLCHPKREAWLLVGFVPDGDAEQATLHELRQSLEFDPSTDAHRLNGRHNEPRDAKRVLRELVASSPNRERQCWEQTDLHFLEDRGTEVGLAGFISEIRERLIPLLTAKQQS